MSRDHAYNPRIAYAIHAHTRLSTVRACTENLETTEKGWKKSMTRVLRSALVSRDVASPSRFRVITRLRLLPRLLT